MDDFGEIGYIVFFIFLIIVNAIAGAAKRRRKREQQRQGAPTEEPGTKSLEDVIRELTGGSPPPKRSQPKPDPVEAPVEAPEVNKEEYVNPYMEYLQRKEREADNTRLEVSSQPPIMRARARTEKPTIRVDLREAIIHSELIMKPRWKEW